jgi:hypothetical protein
MIFCSSYKSTVAQVSGNGQLENSGQNGYDGLDLYLVSAQTNTNITVSNNSDILNQEPGGTVKHLNWQIPGCISSGQYNVGQILLQHIGNSPSFLW